MVLRGSGKDCGGRLQRQDVARLYSTMAVRVRNLNVILV